MSSELDKLLSQRKLIFMNNCVYCYFSVGQSCLVCIARRLTITEKTNTMLGIEQFTTKQDINGKILAFDTR